MSKPQEQQNPQAIQALNRSIGTWREEHPEEAKMLDEGRLKRLELNEKLQAADKTQQLVNAQADMTRMLAANTPIEEIAAEIGRKYPLAEAAESLETLEKYQAAAEKLTNRESTAAAVASLPTELKALVKNANVDEATRKAMEKDIDFLMKDRELLPNQAMKRAEEFAQRLAAYELGVNRDRAAAGAAEDAKYKGLVHRVRLQRTTEAEMDRAWEVYENAVSESNGWTPDIWGNQVDYAKVKGLADAMRMAEAGLEEFTPYVFEKGMPKFDPETGQPLMKENFDHADVFEVQSYADPSASQGTYVPPQTNDDTQSARRARQRGVVGSNQPPTPEQQQQTTLDQVNAVIGGQ
jgi:hypothetical protein